MQIDMVLDTTAPSLSRQGDDIMSRVNFARCLQVMHAINWRWRGNEVTLDDLKSNALYLIDTAIRSYNDSDSGRATVSTGGFAARVVETEQGPRLTLSFTVEEIDAYMY